MLVEPVPARGVEGAAHVVPVELPGLHAAHERMEDEARALLEPDDVGGLAVRTIEEARYTSLPCLL